MSTRSPGAWCVRERSFTDSLEADGHRATTTAPQCATGWNRTSGRGRSRGMVALASTRRPCGRVVSQPQAPVEEYRNQRPRIRAHSSMRIVILRCRALAGTGLSRGGPSRRKAPARVTDGGSRARRRRAARCMYNNFSPHLSTAKDGRGRAWATANNVGRLHADQFVLVKPHRAEFTALRFRARRDRPRQPQGAGQHDPPVHRLAQQPCLRRTAPAASSTRRT